MFREEICFEWDEVKDLINRNKHGISFREASSVFRDEDAVLFDDPFHSMDEERFLIVGMSRSLRLLTVVHCVREESSTIRIISTRKASVQETKSYTKRKRR